MKTLSRLLIIIALFSSCVPTSHVPCMPSDPMFTGALQTKVSTGIALDHIETQAAISVLPFLGLTGDYYWGTKGIEQMEYGANLFLPLNKGKTLFVSLAGGVGDGTFKGRYYTWNFMGTHGYIVDNKYNSFYLQPSVYLTKKINNKIYSLSISFKHVEVFYSKFDLASFATSGSDAYTYTHSTTKKNAYTIIQTPFVGGTVSFDNMPFFIQGQIGYNIVTKRFKTDFKNHTGGSSYRGEFEKHPNPRFTPIMLNLTVGLQIDFFRLGSRKNKSY